MYKIVILILLLPIQTLEGQNFIEKSRNTLFVNTDSSIYYISKYLEKKNISDSINYAEAQLILGQNHALLGDTELALQQFINARKIFANLTYTSGEIEAVLNMGEMYYNWANYDKAYQFFQRAYILAIENNIQKPQVVALNYIGKYYHSIGNFDESIKHYHLSYNLAKQLNDTLGIIAIQNKIGKHYETLGEYAIALEYYLNSDELIQHTNNLVEKATTYNHLGNIHHLLSELDIAAQFHIKSLQNRKKLNYKEGIAKSLNNLGELLVDLQQPDSALNCFKESYQLCNELDYVKGMIKSIHNQGIINKVKHNYHIALKNFETALNLSMQTSYDKGILNAYYDLAAIQLNLKHNKLAIEYALRGLELAENKDVKAKIGAFNLLLSKIYELSNPKIALDFYKKYHETHDEILNLESNKKIAELETQFEVSLKSRENDVLRQENEINELRIKRKNTLIVSIIAILALASTLAFLVYLRYLQKQKANRELDKLNKNLNESIKQQVKLFSIIGHELRNPLWWFRNLVQMLTSQIDSLDKKMIKKSLNSMNESATHTFHLMDNLLHWSRTQSGTIKFNPVPVVLNHVITENIKLIQYLADIKNIRIHTKWKNDFTVFADKNMLQTIVRNLLSNALKFTPEKGHIEIQIKKDGDFIKTKVSDSGIGMDNTVLDKIFIVGDAKIRSGLSNETGSGLGLMLCKEFVEKNGGKISVESEPDEGSVFKFTLPVYQKNPDKS